MTGKISKVTSCFLMLFGVWAANADSQAAADAATDGACSAAGCARDGLKDEEQHCLIQAMVDAKKKTKAVETISKAKLGGLDPFNHIQPSCSTLMEHIDNNEDGAADFDEVMDKTYQDHDESNGDPAYDDLRQHTQTLFTSCDTDADNQLDCEELHCLMGKVEDDSASLLETSVDEHDIAPDLMRARKLWPSKHLRAPDASSLTKVLNAALQKGAVAFPRAKPCEEFSLQDLHELQTEVFGLREPQLLAAHAREPRHESVQSLVAELNSDMKYVKQHPEVEEAMRDGRCGEIAMHWVHHLSKQGRSKLAERTMPLLPQKVIEDHSAALVQAGHEAIAKRLRNQLSCGSATAPAPPPPPALTSPICCECVRKLRRLGMCLDTTRSEGDQNHAFELSRRHSECASCWDAVGADGFRNCPDQIRCNQCTSEGVYDRVAYDAQWPSGGDWKSDQSFMYPMTYYGTYDPYAVYCHRLACPGTNSASATWCSQADAYHGSGQDNPCRNQCHPHLGGFSAPRCGWVDVCPASLTQSTNQSHPTNNKEEDASRFRITKDTEKPAMLEESIVRKSNEC